MKNTKGPGIRFALLMLSGVASAGVPTTPGSRDLDIGTLTPDHKPMACLWLA
jgi:hypothetical protein